MKDSENLIFLSIFDDSSATNSFLNVKDLNGGTVGGGSYSPKPNYNGIDNLNINITLVDFTQMKIDMSVIDFSVTTTKYDANYLNHVNQMKINSDKLDVHSVDFDCV